MNEQIYNLSGAIKSRRPVLAEVLNKFGHLTVGEYVASFKNSGDVIRKTIQSKDDFVKVCSDYTKRLVGPEVAEKIKNCC